MTARRLFGGPENVLARMNRLVISGLYAPPVWYSAVRRVPPTIQASHPHPGRIVFPEDRLYRALYQRIPSLQDEPLIAQDISQETTGGRIARRWLKEIEGQGGGDEDAAWQRVIADKEVQGWLSGYEERMKEAKDNPITAGNISRHVEAKLRSIGLIRHLAPTSPPDLRRAEIGHALSALEVSRRQSSDPTEVGDEDDGLAPERRELVQRGRQWLVPDMREYRDIRFIVAPQNAQLNEKYRVKRSGAAQRKRAVGQKEVKEDMQGEDMLHWAMSKAVVQESASLRDWIAYVLRLQVVVMRLYDLVSWTPYTDCIDSTLWRQSRVVLRCRRIETLVGEDMERKTQQLGKKEFTNGLVNRLPLVHHHLQPRLNMDEQRKHALVTRTQAPTTRASSARMSVWRYVTHRLSGVCCAVLLCSCYRLSTMRWLAMTSACTGSRREHRGIGRRRHGGASRRQKWSRTHARCARPWSESTAGATPDCPELSPALFYGNTKRASRHYCSCPYSMAHACSA